MCPTARSLPVGDAALNTFEQRVQGANLTEDHIWYFPKYGKWPSWLWWPARPPRVPTPAALTPPGPAGFCDTADQFHVLDGEWQRGRRSAGGGQGVPPWLSVVSVLQK